MIFVSLFIFYLARARAIFAYSLLATMPSNWIFELRADKTAKTFAGEQSTIEMLRKLDKKGDPNENSLTHPSINSRINQLQSETVIET